MIGIKSKIDKQSLQESKQLFTEHLKDLQKVAEQNTIKVDIKQSTENLNKIKDSVKGIENTTKSASEGFKGLNSSIETIGSFYLKWASITSIINTSINAIKSGISEISQLDASNVRISMIQNSSVENVRKMNGELMEMSKKLGELNSQTMAGFESWARSGIEDTKTINANLETTMKLARIAGMDNGAMADSLIVLKNAYDMNSESLKIYASHVSKLDNSSATSSKKINEAMQSSAETFKAMGVDIDTALSWITNFSEKSNMAGTAIGNHFKSLMTNFHTYRENVKNGNKEVTDSFNKIEQILSEKAGISLRKNKDEWRDLGSVIRDIQLNINKFSQTDLSKLSFAIGGKENMEMTLSTIKNMERINQLQADLKSDQGGKALDEAHSKYINSIEYKTNNLKNNITSMWQSLINSNAIKTGIDGLSRLVQMLSYMANEGRITTIAMGGLALVIANIGNLKKAFDGINDSIMLMKAGMFSLNFNPVMLALTGITALVGIWAYKHSKAKEEIQKDINDLKGAYESLGESIKNMETVQANDKRLKEMEDKVGKAIKLKEQLAEVERKLAEAEKLKANHEDEPQDYKELIQQQRDLTEEIKKQDEVMKNAGVSIEEYNELKNDISNINTANAIRKESEVIMENRQHINELTNEYKFLSSQENLNVEQKQRLSTISYELGRFFRDLTVSVDQNGNAVVLNSDLLYKNVEAMNGDKASTESLTNAKLDMAKQTAYAFINGTKITYQQILTNISMYETEIESLSRLAQAKLDANNADNKPSKFKSGDDAELGMVNTNYVIEENKKVLQSGLKTMNDLKAKINEQFKTGFSGGLDLPKSSYDGGGGYTPSVVDDDGKKGKKSSGEKDVDNIKLKLDYNKQYKDSLKLVNTELEKNKKLEENLHGDDLVNAKKKDIEFLTIKSTLNDKMIQNNQKAEQASRKLLESFGFQFNNDGVITNMDLLNQKAEESNKLSGKQKENAIQNIKNIQEEIGVHTAINSELSKGLAITQDLANEAKKFNTEIMNLQIKGIVKKFDELDVKIKETFADLDLKSDILGDKDIDGQMEVLLKRKDLIQQQIDAKVAEMDALTKIVVTSDEDKKALDKKYKEQQDSLRELQKSYVDLGHTIEEQNRKKMQLIETVESKITDMMKKQYENRRKEMEDDVKNKKKALEDKYKAEDDYWKKIKKLYNDANAEADRDKELGAENKRLTELKDTYQKSLRDLSAYGQARSEDLRKQIEEQESKIGNVVEKQERDRYNSYLDDKINKSGEKKNEELKKMDDDVDKMFKDFDAEWDNKSIAKKVKDAMQSGFYKDVYGDIKEVETGYMEFLDKFENGTTMAGQGIKKEFLDNFKEMKQNIKDVSFDNEEMNKKMMEDYAKTGETAKTEISTTKDEMSKLGEAMGAVEMASKMFTDGLVEGVKNASSEITNNLIPALERIKGINVLKDLNLTPEQAEKIANGKFINNSALMKAIPNMSGVGSINTNNRNSKTEVNLHFGDIKTDASADGIMNAIKSRKNEFAGIINGVNDKNLYGTV